MLWKVLFVFFGVFSVATWVADVVTHNWTGVVILGSVTIVMYWLVLGFQAFASDRGIGG